jgi:hypothetical protein
VSTTTASNESSMDSTLSYAHGTIMVITWMMFSPTCILFARYGRSLHIGKRVKILGELIWFQAHRLALCIVAIATLLGFFLILARGESGWVDVNAGHLFAHSVLGAMVVCCSQIQVWMIIFRCHQDSRFRLIFNWIHRFSGLLACILSIPTIFLITFVLPNLRSGFLTILSLWSIWVVIIVLIFEIIEYRHRKISILSANNFEFTGKDSPSNIDVHRADNWNVQSFRTITLILFCIHIIIATCLTIPLIVLIWKQD